LNGLLAKGNHTSDASWNFLCVFIQFVNGHSVNDDEPPWLVAISLFFFSGVTDDYELPWLVVIYLFFLSSVVDDSKPGGLSSFLS
jgi:hypothetical protein